MNTLEKIKILGAAGKFDICASSASKRKVSTHDTVGNAASSGICHSFTPDGRCISLFKTLMSNSCTHDCKYCQNTCSKRKAMFEPEELAKIFMSLYVRNYVEGIFLSSGIVKDADSTTQKMLDTCKILRTRYKFHGYIHFKALPGVSQHLLKEASDYSDRISINLEVPNSSRMSEISSVKNYKSDILKRQFWIKKINPPSGQTTQMVIGSSDETDLEILNMVRWEYENVDLKRAYFSAFTPVENTPFQNKTKAPLSREHALYQTDWLLRIYNFKFSQIKDILEDGMLPKIDPKVAFARKFITDPIDINKAGYEELLKIPGIGPRSAMRIRTMQNSSQKITKREQLHNMGVVLKRAEPFISILGSHQKTLTAY